MSEASGDLRRLEPRIVLDAALAGGTVSIDGTPGDDVILVVCLLDPHREHETTVWWDLPSLGLPADAPFVAHDLVTDATWSWPPGTYVRLSPWEHVAHIVHVRST